MRTLQVMDIFAQKQGSPNQDTYNIVAHLKYVTFCYPLEVNVHDGHNTDSLQRDIMKRNSPIICSVRNLTKLYFLVHAE